MSDPEELEAALEQERAVALAEGRLSVCPEHGDHETLVCVPCYARQQERVERESAPLRYANTTEALRTKVLAELAERNGG